MEKVSLAKAVIINADTEEQIACLFNPKEYTFTRQNEWETGKQGGKNTQPLNFKNGKPATLKMQLFFDTYADKQDVRETYTDKIWSLMSVVDEKTNPRSKKSSPPYVRFQWGRTWSFEAVIMSITQKFTLFLPDGRPVRATLDVTFQQLRDAGQLRAQNPTSGGEGGERVWRVSAGDSLAWIAYKVYGDSTNWRPIAEANHLTNLRRLEPGMILVIPND